MLKRTLIAIAVVALMASSVHAIGPEPYWPGGNEASGKLKIEPEKMNIFWPFVEYKKLDICIIPIRLEIGIFVEVKDCNKRKIELVQVDCGDIGKGGGDFPCYSDCEDVEIRTNFPITIGTRLIKESNVIDKWTSYYKEGDDKKGSVNIDPTGSSWQKVTVCVDAWKARLYEEEHDGTAGKKVNVGKLAITVKPNV
jgi:hypothetical protein